MSNDPNEGLPLFVLYMYDDKELTTKETITEGWANLFQSLATPANGANYDDEYLSKTETIYQEICIHLQRNTFNRDPISIDETGSAMKKLNVQQQGCRRIWT